MILRELKQGKTRRFWEICNAALTEVLEALGEEAGGRTGVVYRVYLARDSSLGLRGGWSLLDEGKCGTQADAGNWQKYDDFSYEKYIRLVKYHAKFGHVSAAQTRDPSIWQPNGAFVLEVGEDKILFASSGLPEHGDEALNLRIAQKCGWGSMEAYENLLSHSQNDFALEFLRAAA